MDKLEKIGYRFVGPSKHSAVKVCTWVKNSLGEKGVCYKQKFYGIESHRCVQMSPAVHFCNHRCVFCWRFIEDTIPNWSGPVDEPDIIIDECIKEQKKFIQGFGGNQRTNKTKLYQAERPKHFAISLAGEPLFYPKISELISRIKERGMTAFLVTNGTLPEILKDMEEPTQLYITLPAPNEEIYQKTCSPLIKDGWKKIMTSLSFLENFECNTVIRLTLANDFNFSHPEQYSRIIEKANPKFLEVKAFMSIAAARERLPFESMPLHSKIREFAEKIEQNSSYKIADEQKESRVVLMKK